MHARIHTYLYLRYTHTHTYTHTHLHIYVHACIHTYAYIHIHTQTQTYTHTLLVLLSYTTNTRNFPFLCGDRKLKWNISVYTSTNRIKTYITYNIRFFYQWLRILLLRYYHNIIYVYCLIWIYINFTHFFILLQHRLSTVSTRFFMLFLYGFVHRRAVSAVAQIESDAIRMGLMTSATRLSTQQVAQWWVMWWIDAKWSVVYWSGVLCCAVLCCIATWCAE
jgi:hypothetical protein